MDYKIIYSIRKTVGISIKNGEIIIRAPKRTPKKIIKEIIIKNQKWIENALIKKNPEEKTSFLLTRMKFRV